MGKWWRCPICGRLCLERNIDKNFPIEVFNQVGLGRARGWRYDKIFDIGIVERIKNKIKALYERYFVETKIQLRVPIIPSVFLNESPGLGTNPPILVKSEVKLVG